MSFIERLRVSVNLKTVEWLLALITISWGIRLLVSPSVFEGSSGTSYELLAQMAPEAVWGAIFLATGVFRLVVLVINGAWSASPHWRATTAAISAFLWFSLVVGFAQSGFVGTAVTVYPWLLLFEMRVAYRCAAEAGQIDRRRKEGGQWKPTVVPGSRQQSSSEAA